MSALCGMWSRSHPPRSLRGSSLPWEPFRHWATSLRGVPGGSCRGSTGGKVSGSAAATGRGVRVVGKEAHWISAVSLIRMEGVQPAGRAGLPALCLPSCGCGCGRARPVPTAGPFLPTGTSETNEGQPGDRRRRRLPPHCTGSPCLSREVQPAVPVDTRVGLSVSCHPSFP